MDEKENKIAIVLNQSIEKVKQYYATTGRLIYTVATGKFDYIKFSLYLYILIIYLIIIFINSTGFTNKIAVL
jgi:hypothetical protein